MKTLKGALQVDMRRAVLTTRDGRRMTLVPYPREVEEARVAITEREMERAGSQLFSYLDGEDLAISGDVAGDRIFNARVAGRRAARLRERRGTQFADDIAQYFSGAPRTITHKLDAAGISSVAALYHRIRNDAEEEEPAFARYLGVSRAAIKGFVRSVATDAPPTLVAASPRAPVQRGVSLGVLKTTRKIAVKERAAAAPPGFPRTAFTPKLRSRVDLAASVTRIKSQGARATCVAHAAVACIESGIVRSQGGTRRLDLSEQYLYWACKQLDGSPKSEGTLLEYAVEALVNGVPRKKYPAGVCEEADWRYTKLPITGNESQDPPPQRVSQAFGAGRQRRAAGYKLLRQDSIPALKTALAKGECVGLSVYTYPFWTDDYTWRQGRISMPVGEKPDGAHAICLVGYRDEDGTHGDGHFMFKNSWDVTWGYERPDPGFGTLPYRYVIGEAIEAYSIQV